MARHTKAERSDDGVVHLNVERKRREQEQKRREQEQKRREENQKRLEKAHRAAMEGTGPQNVLIGALVPVVLVLLILFQDVLLGSFC